MTPGRRATISIEFLTRQNKRDLLEAAACYKRIPNMPNHPEWQERTKATAERLMAAIEARLELMHEAEAFDYVTG